MPSSRKLLGRRIQASPMGPLKTLEGRAGTGAYTGLVGAVLHSAHQGSVPQRIVAKLDL